MRKTSIYLAAACILASTCAVRADAISDWKPPVPMSALKQAKAALIPFPRKVEWKKSDFIPNNTTKIVYPKAQAWQLAGAIELLRQVMAKHGFSLTAIPQSAGAKASLNTISISLMTKQEASQNPEMKPEGYKMTVNENGVSISGKDSAGAFYGVDTLRQMIRGAASSVRIQECTMTDWPAFKLRGFMLDTGRNFMPFKMLKAQMDILAEYKINRFHWHLTDNPGWRIESKAFPQLNDPKFQTRDKGKIYTYAQIRELCAYAKARHITIIPEIDMPGHSAAFKRAMGFSMGSPKGIDALVKIINEFCHEIPTSDCPILHIGADEVRIKNSAEFMARVLKTVRANGRQPMVWNPGLHADDKTIAQLWSERTRGRAPGKGQPFVDSTGGYLNNYDPLITIQRYYFWQACLRPAGDQQALGGILCCWNDVRVADKINVYRDNPVWSALLTFSDAIWDGRPTDGLTFQKALPPPDSLPGQYFHEFEHRLAANRDRFFANLPFPYVQFGEIPWNLIGPFVRPSKAPDSFAFAPEKKIEASYQTDNGKGSVLKWKEAWGGVLNLANHGMVPKDHKLLARSTVYALNYIYSPTAKTTHAWIGFEVSTRSNRGGGGGGIPKQGEWDGFGAQVWLNNAPVPAPHWEQPGKYRYLHATWHAPANEIPFTDEEFYWLRNPPAAISLHAGWNKVLIRVPCGYAGQHWHFTFIPVTEKPGQMHWTADQLVKFSTKPHNSF